MTGGLHGKAERCARGVTVYLVPGLTACQRRAVIRRLRQEASRGLSPDLPLPQLAIAFGLDRACSAARIVGGMVRLHPGVTLVPGVFVVALMALFVVATANRAENAPARGLSSAEAVAQGSGRAAREWPAGPRVLPYVAATTEGGGKAIEGGPGRGPVFPVTAVTEADGGVANDANGAWRHCARHARRWRHHRTGSPALAGPGVLAGPAVLATSSAPAGQPVGSRPPLGVRRSSTWYDCSHGRPASREQAASRAAAASRGGGVSLGSAWTAGSHWPACAAVRSRSGRHACRCSMTGGMPPCTAHFPGPRALA